MKRIASSVAIGKPFKSNKSSSPSTAEMIGRQETNVHPFFKQNFKSTGETFSTEWKTHDTMLYAKYTPPFCGNDTDINSNSSNLLKVAAFDLDNTVIATKSGKKLPRNQHDWQFWSTGVNITKKFRNLSKQGYTIVIFTNQAGIGLGKLKPEIFKEKMNTIVQTLNVPVEICAATMYDWYRKPCLGMWEYFLQVNDANTSTKAVDLFNSFYVGDAAGRVTNWKPNHKKDFMDTDRKFALNIGVTFHTPEEFFLNEPPAPYQLPKLDPSNLKNVTVDNPINISRTGCTELVLFVGSPASGKSTFTQRHFSDHGYVVVNQDTLHTRDKCIKTTEEALRNNCNVVIDNTNPDIATRRLYVEIAQRLNVPIRVIHFRTPVDLAKHLNKLRSLTSSRGVLPDIAFSTFYSRYQEPSTDEGFSEVIGVDFIPKWEGKQVDLAHYWLH